MKMAILVIGIIIVVYLLIQAVYTGYYLNKSKALVKKTYTGQKLLGNSNNPKLKLFIDGDSVGAGVGASSFETSVAGRIANHYAKNNHVELTNNSVSGSRMETLEEKTLPTNKQDLTVLVVSSNDLFHFSNLSRFKKATEKVLKKYSANTDKLILIGPGRVFDTSALPYLSKPLFKSQGSKYAEIIADEAKKYPNVVYVNPLEVEVSKEKYGKTDAIDGFHPNDEGHRFWFDLIKEQL